VLVAVLGSYLVRSIGISVEDGEKGRLAFIRRAVLALSAQFTPPDAGILIPLMLVLVVMFLMWAFIQGRVTAGALCRDGGAAGG
jgi:hypothetical protein